MFDEGELIRLKGLLSVVEQHYVVLQVFPDLDLVDELQWQQIK